MSLKISLITTSNCKHSFTLDNAENISLLLPALKRSAQIFSGKPLIVSLPDHTEIFATSTICCIEIETQENLDSYLPGGDNLGITALTAEQSAIPFTGGLEGEHVDARLTFKLQGGHILNTHAEGQRKAALAERLMSLTSIFERPVIVYHLPQGGVGLLNPHNVTHLDITPSVVELPRDAWIAS